MQGRSAILDVHAVDSTKKEFDVEIQRSDSGAYQSKSNIVTALERVYKIISTNCEAHPAKSIFQIRLSI